MNSLTIVIYLFYLMQTLKISLLFGAILLGLVSVFTFLSSIQDYTDKLDEYRKNLSFKILAVSIVFFFLYIFIPNEKTMYLMAASEVSERAIDTQIGQEIIQRLREELSLHEEDN